MRLAFDYIYMILKIELNGCLVRFLKSMWNCKDVDESVVDYMFLWCFEWYDVYKTCKRLCKSFWVIGGSKLGFWMKMGFENRSFETAQMSVRSSEQTVAQASDIVRAQDWNLTVRLSVSQANAKRTKLEVSTFASLKRRTSRLGERR